MGGCLKAELGFWEKHAGKFKFIASDDLTLAGVVSTARCDFCDLLFYVVDFMMGPFFVSLRRFGASFEDYPNLKKYSDMMKVEWFESPSGQVSDDVLLRSIRCW